MPSNANGQRETWISLDGLRGASILSVVWVHVWAHASTSGKGLPVIVHVGDLSVDLTWFFATGHNAVEVFFVLSGFLLYRHWLEERNNRSADTAWTRNRRFYGKRARRILPAFLFFSIVYLLCVGLVGKHHFGGATGVGDILLSTTFLSPLAALAGTPTGSSLAIVPGTWSLNPEMWFYLAMPALAFFFARRRSRWIFLASLLCLTLSYRAWLGPMPSFTSRFWLAGVADAFLVGMAIAGYTANTSISGYAGLLFPLGAGWYLAMCAGKYPFPYEGTLQLVLASALMIVGLVAPGNWPWKRWFSSPTLVWIGHVSFSVFLCNILVLWYLVLPLTQALGLESPGQRFLANMLVGYPLILAFGWAGYRFVETPFLSRTPVQSGRLLRNASALAALMVLVLSVPAMIAYTRSDGLDSEFSGILPRIAWHVFRAPGQVAGSHAVTLTGKATIASETRHTDARVERDAGGDYRIVSAGGKTGDRWIAVVFPVDLTTLIRGHEVFASATLVAAQASDARACLGIYNGEADVCSARAPILGTQVMHVTSLVKPGGRVQFKLNVFPDASGAPFDFRLTHLNVHQ